MRRVMAAVLMAAAVGLAGCATEPATDVTAVSATFNGKGATGERATTYWFEYWVSGEDVAGARRTPERRAPAHTPYGSFSESVRGLTPWQAYHYRLCALVDGDPETRCLDEATFDTPTLAETYCTPREDCTSGYATAVSPTGATLSGRGFSTREPVDWWFEYREETGEYVEWTKLPEHHLTAGAPVARRTQALTGLTPGAYYDYRLCFRIDGGADCLSAAQLILPSTALDPPRPGTVHVADGELKSDGSLPTLGDIQVDATVGPDGPAGTASFGGFIDRGTPYELEVLRFGGRVTCVNVSGASAEVKFLDAGDVVRSLLIRDGGPDGPDRVVWGTTPGGVEDCPIARDSGEEIYYGGTLIDGRATVMPAG